MSDRDKGKDQNRALPCTTAKPDTRSIENESNTPHERLAIALEYDGESAPFITATGEEATAEEIIAIAQAHNIPLMENSELAHLLAKLELGDEIPEILYLSIAQIIAFVYMLQGKAPTDH